MNELLLSYLPVLIFMGVALAIGLALQGTLADLAARVRTIKDG